MPVLSYLTTAQDKGSTVYHILAARLHIARSLISRLKTREGGICVDGRRVFVNAVVDEGELVTADVSDFGGENRAEPIHAPVDIVYEDQWLAIINKSPFMAVHGGEGEPTLANALAALWGHETAFHAVNRLDKGTSGLMIAAKCGYIHDALRRLLHSENYRREYLALCRGSLENEGGVIKLPISAKPVEGTRRAIDPKGLESETEYEVLRRYEGATLVLVRPLTGRTHQIRLHFSAISHPLLGDGIYGTPSPLIGRPALHSHHILLKHPVGGEIIDVRAPLPEDMERLFTNFSLLI